MILKSEGRQDYTSTSNSLSTERLSMDSWTNLSDSENDSNSSTLSLIKSENPFPSLPPPPRYSTLGQFPKAKISYAFIPQTSPANSMIVKPLDGINIVPVFYISVSMNCFVPSSYITTIRKDGWDGEVVGDFELAFDGARKVGTVSLHGDEYKMDDVFGVVYKMFRMGSYHWIGRRFKQSISTTNLRWEETTIESSPTSMISCFPEKGDKDKNEIARLSVPNGLRRPGRSKEFTRLDISPDGYSCLEEIVISLLIVERVRRTNSVANARKM